MPSYYYYLQRREVDVDEGKLASKINYVNCTVDCDAAVFRRVCAGGRR